MSESFKSVAKGVLEIFEEVYLEGEGHNVAPRLVFYFIFNFTYLKDCPLVGMG